MNFLRCSGLSLSRRYLGGWSDREQVAGLGIDPKVARLEADRLVAQHWGAIVRVAVKLHDAAVFEPDVVEALGGSDDEIHAAAERSRQREETAAERREQHDTLVRLLRLRASNLQRGTT